MMCLKCTCLLCGTSDFCSQYVQKHGESEDEKLEGVKLYEWKVCIYKQNSQNFVTNMRKMRLLELLSYIFIVNLSTYKSDIETFSHLTLPWFLLDL